MKKGTLFLIFNLLLFLIPLLLVLGAVFIVSLAISFDIKVFVLISIIVTELSFLLGEWFLKKSYFAKEFFVSFFLVVMIFAFSFGGMVAQIFRHITISGNDFTFIEIVLIVLNTFWAYSRGLARIGPFVKEKST